MSRKKTPKQSKAALRASATPSGVKRRFGLLLIASLAAAAISGIAYFVMAPHTPAPLPAPSAAKSETERKPVNATFVGANACMQCHQNEFKAWSGSHHQLAMQPKAT